MTELETLFFKDQYSLRLDIGKAIEEADTNALANYRREFSFEHRFTAVVSFPSTLNGTLTLESKEEMDAVAEYEWRWDFNKFEEGCDSDPDYCSYDCNSTEVEAYALELLNPSPEAQEMLRKQAEDKKTEQTTRKVWNAIRSLVRATKGAENWSLAEEQQFVQEKTEELTKALVALN